jgi:hypothetical protein
MPSESSISTWQSSTLENTYNRNEFNPKKRPRINAEEVVVDPLDKLIWDPARDEWTTQRELNERKKQADEQAAIKELEEKRKQTAVEAIIAAAAKEREEAQAAALAEAAAAAEKEKNRLEAEEKKKASGSGGTRRKDKDKEKRKEKKKTITDEEKEKYKEKKLLKLISPVVVNALSKHKEIREHEKFKKFAREVCLP